MRRLGIALLVATGTTTQAADIGGWMEQKSRADLPRDDCPALIAQAARTPRDAHGAAHSYYAGGLCYLYSERVARDPVAAAAWLTRAAELDHPLARRTLIALRDPAQSAHATQAHCHDLGAGRQLCHGASPPPEKEKSP